MLFLLSMALMLAPRDTSKRVVSKLHADSNNIIDQGKIVDANMGRVRGQGTLPPRPEY